MLPLVMLIATTSARSQTLLPPTPMTAEQGDATMMLERAIVRLERQPSVAASLRQRIDLYGRRLVGSGSYHQMNAGKDLLFRTELKIPLGDTITSLLQVCNGRYLWTYRALPHEDAQRGLQTTLTRVDLNTVRKRGIGYGGSWAQGIGYGGLPGLLKQALRLFEFGEATRGELHGVPVWQLLGTLREETSERLLGKDKEGNQRKRAPHIPDMVSVTLGIDDLFPYRIDYRRQSETSDSQSRAKSLIAGGTKTQSLVTLEVFEVQTGQTIDPQMFFFRPTDVQVEDATDAFIRNQLTSRQSGS